MQVRPCSLPSLAPQEMTQEQFVAENLHHLLTPVVFHWAGLHTGAAAAKVVEVVECGQLARATGRR